MAVMPKVDVVTVGAGWTAGILAQKLTAQGKRVVSIEAGPDRWANPHFAHNHDGLYHTVRTGLMHNLNQETWTWRPNPRAPSLPMRQYGSFHPGLGVGGAGIHWAAQYWRFHPNDFRYRSHHVERYGAERIPDFCTIQDWPLTYEELEPFYDQSDYEIGISGQTGNLGGTILPGGNPFEGPRRRPYPLPPVLQTSGANHFTETTRQMGYHPFTQPSGILSQAYRDLSGRERAGCIYCGFCVRYGCEVDAKSSANVSHIPLAMDTGLYEIRSNAKVIRVNVGRDGLATGITYRNLRTNEEHEQPADVVVLSAFTLTNIRLMLLSTSEQHPQGIGNDRGRVGKNYSYQLQKTPATGVFEGRQWNFYMGNSSMNAMLHDFYGDNFDHSELDFIGGASIEAGAGGVDTISSAFNLPPLEEAPEDESTLRDYPVIPGEVGSLSGDGMEWGQAWKTNLRNNWNSVMSIGIQGESLPYEDQFLDLDPTYKDNFGLPLLRLTYDFHPNDYKLYSYVAARVIAIMRAMAPTRMSDTPELENYNIYTYQSTHNTGGAIMGTDPGNSVTNKYGQVWDTPNLFVTGAALYPQNPGVNPTGTLIALAYHTADALNTTYFRTPGEVIG